ncbi:MAG: PKD domain-containing protein, partial [Euryarchaeota archaeon]|nr:PKD domain-containing protein [Euryarchaeota archaeon]
VAISWSFDFAAKNGTGYYRFFTIGVDNATNVESAPGSGYDVNCSYEFLAPTSIVDTITTYWKTSSPLAITGTAAPHNMSGLKNVTLYYRYASSNNSYGGWVNHSVDVDPWTAISWSFGFSNGTGWYEFYSIANDNASNAESAPENNDTICGYDIPIVTITVPANNSFYNVLTTISGTTSMVSDLSFGGINRTNLTIYNSTGAGTYWNGTAWASGVTWLNATGYTSWTYNSTNVTWVNNTYYYVNATAVDNDSNDGVTVTSNFTFDTYAPEITAVNAGSITTSSATITWTTEQAANSTVEYGLTNSYGTSTADATFSTSHSVALPSNLSSGTRYHYRTVSYDQAGNRANSSDQTFTTSSGESTPSSNTAPTAEAGGPYSGFVNQTITFNGSRSTDDVGVTRYRWDWTNDGTYDTDWIASATITHMYTAVGNYTVKLQVRDIANLTGTDTATVAVTAPTVQHQAPVADMNGPYNALTYQAIQFDGSNSHGTDGIIVNYTWNFGDGIYGYDLSPLHSYDSAGTFSVTLTVKDINDLQDIATSTATILLDANRNNISDIMEQTIGVNITTSDIQPIEISNAMFDLVDTNGDGILDTFYNPTTNTKSTLGQQDGKQLIDVNDDGIWDYVYDPAAGTTTPYVVVTTPPVDNNWMPIIGIVVAIIIIIVLIVVVLIKKGRLYVEKKPKDEGEPKKPDESKKGK